MFIKKYIKRFYYRLKSNYTTEDLILKGLVVGDNFLRMHDVILDPSHCWLINIGDNVTLAPRVHILCHDASTKIFLNYTKIGRVTLGNNVFIGADTVILPNVSIGDNVVVGAKSTVSKNLESNAVYAGNPAKFICSIEHFKEKNNQLMQNTSVYGLEYRDSKKLTIEMKEKMKNDLKDSCGYIF